MYARHRVKRPGGPARAAVAVLVAMLCQASLVLSPYPTAAATPGQDDLIARQQQVEREKEKVRARLRSTKSKQRAAGHDLKVVESRLRAVRRELVRADAELRSTRTELEQATRSLAAAEARLDNHRETASDRLVAIYESGGIEYLEVLTAAASFADFANRLYLVKLIVDEDLRLLRAMTEERARIASYRRRVEERERSVVMLEARVARKHDEEANRRRQKAHVVSDLRQQRIYWERALAQMEADSRDIAAQIRRYQRTTGRSQYSTPWTGSFMRPVNGSITSGYGYRMHPILRVRKMHTGVDIAAAAGTPIRAADAGTVIWSASRGGYGLCVIIDHGGGMSTVYGHCSRLAVRAGQAVSKGQAIGNVGSTGLSTGPHLHFEVRRNGSPVNPLSY
ncbi:MAG: peptidoglycan DD-metalloendopeptidase family protein [Armatimonadota bacterium]|nr:MAG: peptidoglycan DD-metalloendopeptidase family protein [Armatimonadota bacterium]